MQFRSLLAGSAMLALLAGCAAGPTDRREDAGMTASQANYQALCLAVTVTALTWM